MPSPALDYIAATRRCTAALRSIGFSRRADEIDAALLGSATGGELAMAVRWHLRALQHERLALPVEIASLIEEICVAIDATGW